MSSISELNPFVGPRPIRQGEALYGRDVEVRELYHRLQARRIVVLHSPSGAGKSSLVQAGLIPQLVEGVTMSGSRSGSTSIRRGWRGSPRTPIAIC